MSELEDLQLAIRKFAEERSVRSGTEAPAATVR